MDVKTLKLKASENRLKVLEKVAEVGRGHLGGTFSCIEILTCLYYEILNLDLIKLNSNDRDRVLIGKGHACLGLYNILFDLGLLSLEKLDEFGTNSHSLGPQLNHKNLGIETNSGSLGHAIGLSCGLALAARLNKKNYKVFSLVGDAECDEGSIWESVLFASQNKLNNICVIVDRNWLSVTKKIDRLDEVSPLENRFKSYGWETIIIDGHNCEEIIKALKTNSAKPIAIIADTIKGKGVSFMESGIKWHHSIPTKNEYLNARSELENQILKNKL